MSYTETTPTYYEMGVPATPFHAGAPGWSLAPWPSWGNNPVRRGPDRLAVDGCGCGVGETVPAAPGLTVAVGVGITLALTVMLYYAMASPPRRAR